MDAATLAPEVISKITDAEKKITHQDNPVANGPTAKAQKHAGEKIDSEVLHDITEGEKNITKLKCPVAGGPSAIAQSQLAKCNNDKHEEHHSGNIDIETICKITQAEKKITKQLGDIVLDGPTAMAQKHAGEPINSKALHDITEGEKRITHENRPIASGPTAVIQSELAKSKQESGSGL